MLHYAYYVSLILCCLQTQIIAAGEVGDICTPAQDISNGICKLVSDCNSAISLIKETGYHSFSRCGFINKDEIVCCPNNKPTAPTKIRNSNGDRIADRECQKIMNTTIPPLGSHIIGGTDALLGEFPFQVTLGYNVTNNVEYDFLCGGSLISDTYILTAAHCLDTINKVRPVIARMGVVDIGDNHWNRDSDIRIEQILTHPAYIRNSKYYDLALIKLEHAVTFTPILNPICLYTKNEDPTVTLSISGWGKTDLTRYVSSPNLQKATVTVVPKSVCEKAYPKSRRLLNGISDDQICAGNTANFSDTCQGDSGGPLQGMTHNDGFPRLVGVTSYGRGCGSSYPGVYTRVSSYLDWIENVVWTVQE